MNLTSAQEAAVHIVYWIPVAKLVLQMTERKGGKIMEASLMMLFLMNVLLCLSKLIISENNTQTSYRVWLFLTAYENISHLIYSNWSS